MPLPAGGPGSPGFREAYEAAVAGANAPPIGLARRSRQGSFAALIAEYYAKSSFRTLAESTQRDTRRTLERFREEHGAGMVAHLKPEHIVALMDRMNTPVAANNLLKRLRWLLDFAVAQCMISQNPTLLVKRRKTRTTPHHTWTDEELDQFRAHYPIGSRARLAFCLMFCLAQRGRSDARRMGRQHMRGNAFHFVATKNKADLVIPIDDELAAAIAAVPNTNLTLLLTKAGKPFTPSGFGNWFAEQVKAAGLPKHCVAHRLRKAVARQFAESQATEKQIMAVIGDKDPRAAAVYTAAADQKLLAQTAFDKRTRAKSEQVLANPVLRFANGQPK